MQINSDFWQKAYEFTVLCGNHHDISTFIREILRGISEFCPYDQGIVFFIDDKGIPTIGSLQDIDPHWGDIYMSDFSGDSAYSIRASRTESPYNSTVSVRDWVHEPETDFVVKCIEPRGLKYTLSFSLFDSDGKVRTIFCLDRLRNECFTDDEIKSVHFLFSQLNNLHKFLFTSTPHVDSVKKLEFVSSALTAREQEILDMLCEGFSTKGISDTLFISISTTRKHIANIFAKLQVSSRQELLAMVLNNY